MINDKIIDLHIHSNNSDGTFTPRQLVSIACKNNVGILSITDHDSISGLEEFKYEISSEMLGIKGVEFSSFIIDVDKKIKIHILGYGFDENNYLFKAMLNEMREKRIDKHIRLLHEIKEVTKTIPEEEIAKLDINRYCWFDREVIKVLCRTGYSKEKLEELKQYYKINKFSYGSDYELDAQRVIDVIHSAGGYVIFAHPMAYKFSTDKSFVERVLNKLIKMGIDGVEIYQSDCNTSDSIWLGQVVDKNNLLFSVGSDFHRIENSDGRQIGLGIDNNLCINRTTLTDEIIKEKKFLRR